MKNLFLFFLLFSISNYNLYSQKRIIKGRVISNQFDILVGIPIMINDTVQVGSSDLNGFFHIELPLSEKKIFIRYVGVDPVIIGIVENCDEVEIVMMLTGTGDYITPKRLDKLRKKRFKRLPKLHKKAFQKGLFKTDKACYTQKFISFCEKN